MSMLRIHEPQEDGAFLLRGGRRVEMEVQYDASDD